MGNLLGSPITEKDTHVGITHDSNANAADSPDGGGLSYGISSMQGWRIHMEDAHIAQPFLYAEKLVTDGAGGGDGGGDDGGSSGKDSVTMTPSRKTAIEATLSPDDSENKLSAEVNVTEKTPAKETPSSSTNATTPPSSPTRGKGGKQSGKGTYVPIPLPNHALFACFDGHGGSFAAEYASRNLLRVLCRLSAFCEYAEKWRGRDAYLEGVRASSSSSVGGGGGGDGGEGKEGGREEKQQKRGRDEEKVQKAKERVRAHMDGASSSTSAANDFEFARATYDHELMTLLESALRDAFVDLDAEILREVQGEKVPGANAAYGEGYDLSRHGPPRKGAVGRGVAHLPKEGGGESSSDDADHSSNVAAATTTASSLPRPIPSDDEDAGTTAVCVLTTPKWIVCANAGDSRAVYSRSDHRAVPLSYDHKPDDEDEERRVREAGGYVSGGRVEGDLAVSRGLGDYRFKDLDAVMSGKEGERRGRPVRGGGGTLGNGNEGKGQKGEDVPMMRPSEQKVSPVPDIIVQNRDPKEDEFIVIACDGIWDVQTNQECVRMVADIFGEGETDLGLVCEEILDLCLIKGSKDNMTAAVIKLPKQVIGKGGGVLARRERRGASSTGGGNSDGGEQPLQGRVYNPYVPPAKREGESKGDDDSDDDNWAATRS